MPPELRSIAGHTDTTTVPSGPNLPLLSQLTDKGVDAGLPVPLSGAASFSLAPCFPPVPARIVKKIRALEFVEMRELLPDNISLKERLESLPNRSPSFRDPVVREISSLPTWISAFSSYIAIVAETHPVRVKDMCAYMRLIVQEAQKYGGNGWLTYDSIFRRNHTGPTARWDQLDPSLHIAHIIARADSRIIPPCVYCNEADHRPEDCALATVQHPASAREATGTRYSV